MANFRNNQAPAIPNPWVRKQGQLDPDGFYGLGTIGAMGPAQASTTPDGFGGELAGYATIWPQVVDCPFSVDLAGIPYDTANTYGLRTRCIRKPVADGGGDDDWWYLVPKTLAAAYTAVGRCGLFVDFPMFYDHLQNGFWNHRTPGGVLLDTSTPTGYGKSLWVPQAFNQTFVGTSYDTGSWNFATGTGYGPSGWFYGTLATNCVGFRGGLLTVTCSYAFAQSGTLYIMAAPYDEPWDPTDDGTSAPTTIATQAVSFAAYTGGPPLVNNYTLPAMHALADGMPCNFYAVIKFDAPAPFFVAQYDFSLGYRTDIPAWFFSSTRNKCAPGGIIA